MLLSLSLAVLPQLQAASPDAKLDDLHPYLQVQLPQEGVAFAESAVFGFGTGHYYAGHYRRGLLFLGIETLGLLLTLSSDPTVNTVGWITFGGGRITDATLAPVTARQRAASMVAEREVVGPIRVLPN